MNPLVSFCVFSYNQEKYILEALHGAISQNYEHMEIIISDDCSTDNTQNIISEFVKNYKGPHKIITNYNPQNIGLANHVNKVLYEIATGEFIFLAAGDDISRADRVQKGISFFQKNPETIALGTFLEEIDENSQPSFSKSFSKVTTESVYDLDYYLSDNYRHLYGCTRAFRKKIVELFPPLNSDCPTEDTTLLFRAFLAGKVGELPDALVKYRIHGNNISSSENLKKMNIPAIFKQYDDDFKTAISQKLFPSSKVKILESVLEKRKLARLGTSITQKSKQPSSLSFFSKIKKFIKK